MKIPLFGQENEVPSSATIHRALVTGAGGFIGQHLVKQLREKNIDVRALIRSHPTSFSADVELVQGDLRDFSNLQQMTKNCDTIFHLAGRTHALDEIDENEIEYRSINIEGTRNLLEASLKGGIKRFVFFSSVKAMGEKTTGCVDESHPAQPLSSYGRSKLEAEQLVLNFGKKHSIHTVCLRLPLVYGIGNKGNIFKMISAIDRGFFPPLPPMTGRRSMVHVSNVVEAALLAAVTPEADGQRYLVTDPTPYTSRQLYEIIRQELGKPTPRWHIPLGVLKLLGKIGDLFGKIRGKRFLFDSQALEKLTEESWYSSEKITRELGFKASFTFPNTLKELITWVHTSQP